MIQTCTESDEVESLLSCFTSITVLSIDNSNTLLPIVSINIKILKYIIK